MVKEFNTNSKKSAWVYFILIPALSIGLGLLGYQSYKWIANDGFNTFIEQGWILKFDLLADNGRVHEISKFISPITSTTTLDDASFNYYPNPVTDELTIDWTESDSNIELILIYNKCRKES